MIRIKPLLPRGLYGRAALILIVPIVAIQLVVSTAFIQRHFEGVTRQLTTGVALDLAFVLRELASADDLPEGLYKARAIAAPLEIQLTAPPGADSPREDRRAFYDVSGRAIIETLREKIPSVLAVDVTGEDRNVRVRLASRFGEVEAEISRRRMSATNPHQLLVLMVFASILMTLVAYLFLRNQLRPIARLAEAAAAFGRGERVPYRPRGALEVRAAGRAFLEMRERIERQIEQRTLMLSGVSHDLRTPLTRMRLGLAFLPEDEETRALQEDVAQMERLVAEFLAFVRGDATESDAETDLEAWLGEIVADARRGGGGVVLRPTEGQARLARLRPQALRRALDNLISNALRYGSRAEITLHFNESDILIAIEDDGPGIPAEKHEEALLPFARLGAERDPNRGGGVGLGLSIAADIALSHGGRLRLGKSARLGGLRVEMSLAR